MLFQLTDNDNPKYTIRESILITTQSAGAVEYATFAEE